MPKKKQTAAEKRREFNAKVRERDFIFYVCFTRNGQLIEEYVVDSYGGYGNSVELFEKKHGKEPYQTHHRQQDMG